MVKLKNYFEIFQKNKAHITKESLGTTEHAHKIIHLIQVGFQVLTTCPFRILLYSKTYCIGQLSNLIIQAKTYDI